MNVYIIGTGLIGGSFSLDIQAEYAEGKIYGIDSNAAHLAEAKNLGVIHEAATFAALLSIP